MSIEGGKAPARVAALAGDVVADAAASTNSDKDAIVLRIDVAYLVRYMARMNWRASRTRPCSFCL